MKETSTTEVNALFTNRKSIKKTKKNKQTIEENKRTKIQHNVGRNNYMLATSFSGVKIVRFDTCVVLHVSVNESCSSSNCNNKNNYRGK